MIDVKLKKCPDEKIFHTPDCFLFGTFNCFPQTSDSGYVEPGFGCQAYFDYYFNDSIKTFVEAYPYRFIDQSKGDALEWYWDFGDGQTSNEPNPMHFLFPCRRYGECLSYHYYGRQL